MFQQPGTNFFFKIPKYHSCIYFVSLSTLLGKLANMA